MEESARCGSFEMGMTKSITLIFPHQLFAASPALQRGRCVHVIEDTLFFGDNLAGPHRFHCQKLILHRASMRAYADRLRNEGHQVTYHDYDRELPIGKRLARLWAIQPFAKIHLTDPVDYLLEKRLRRYASKHGIEMEILPTPLFLTPNVWADSHFLSRKKPFMAAFYEAQRKRLGLLLEPDGTPTGGRWSFDEENRKPMPKRGLKIPSERAPADSEAIAEARRYVAEHFPDAIGRDQAFVYPVNHEDAAVWLADFLAHRLELFGPYEDALSERESVLYHSRLTPLLNIGLLTPAQVLEATLKYAATHEVPLASLEGFLRQIVGWREFIYQMYRRHGVAMRKGNHFQNEESLPRAFWTAETGIMPLDLVIRRVLDTGYCHHIERLMVLGSFMLMGGYEPKQIYHWFMEMFIDAYDWVMVPNVYGMSQFADGGIFATKPYLSGANYLRKMSDYTKGEWEDTWDGLFWTFIDRHSAFFAKQHRLGMLVKTWQTMDPAKRKRLQDAADRWAKREILTNTDYPSD
jgi:deoxyribodipyrimidine photolyase-related protein